MVGVSDVADASIGKRDCCQAHQSGHAVRWHGLLRVKRGGQRTVQGVLEDALERLLGHQVTIRRRAGLPGCGGDR